MIKMSHPNSLLDEKINALIGNITSKLLGVHVDELNKDLTTKLTKSVFIGFEINTAIPFKKAKKLFKKHYLKKFQHKFHTDYYLQYYLLDYCMNL